MKITIAKKEYELPDEFTLGQLKRISIATATTLRKEDDPVRMTELVWERRLQVLSIALEGVPGWDAGQSLENMRISNAEISDAYIAILTHAGFVQKGESADMGEAVAETASTGNGSTGA